MGSPGSPALLFTETLELLDIFPNVSGPNRSVLAVHGVDANGSLDGSEPVP